MCLYFDGVFYPVWVVLTIIHLIYRESFLEDLWFVSFIAASSLFILLNPARIYLGYMGTVSFTREFLISPTTPLFNNHFFTISYS